MQPQATGPHTPSVSKGGTPLIVNPPLPASYQVNETGAPHGFVIIVIPVNSPFDIAFNPDNLLMYVTNFRNGTVSVINGTTNTVVATIPVGLFPRGIAFNADNGVHVCGKP